MERPSVYFGRDETVKGKEVVRGKKREKMKIEGIKIMQSDTIWVLDLRNCTGQ